MNFDDLLNEIDGILAKGAEREQTLDRICALMHEKLDGYDWVGFYLAAPGEMLELGPYRGAATDHARIPYGRGVCGQVAVSGRTKVVPDVREEANYLSCSVNVRSEIVAPILVDGVFVGQLDIDSHLPGRFTPEDRVFVEAICDRLEGLFRQSS